MNAAKRVLIVDDSALVRKKLASFIKQMGYEHEFAKNGEDALEKLFAQEKRFDLVTLDINMPVMDGLSTLKRIMQTEPMPVLMVSSLTDGESKTTFEALQEGAIDFVAKPGTFSVNTEDEGRELRSKIQSLIRLPRRKLFLRRRSRQRLHNLTRIKSEAAFHMESKKQKSEGSFERLVLVGSSTGGPKLIEQIATVLPHNYPHPVIVAQHMPANFTSGFAARLQKKSELNVVESSNNLVLGRGMFVISKGGEHTLLSKKASGRYVLKVVHNTQEHFFTPSIDELFCSAQRHFDPGKVLAVELTGIGTDGAKGLLALKQAGARTLAESEESATVYGMPKEAARIGAATKQLPFDRIIEEILEFGK